jgi:hypothetical protein
MSVLRDWAVRVLLVEDEQPLAGHIGGYRIRP